MRMHDIIEKKRHGRELNSDEIEYFVRGYTIGDIPDYQAAALCMAICIRGMSDDECRCLTYSMMHSGDTVDLSSLPNTVDKHSTGGVADLTSLVVAPTAAVLGLSVAKMSGRALGHTGGTIDKLESIPGFKTSLEPDEFMRQVRNIGVAIIGQSANLTPADKKLYALRDVTATVDSIPLIASSIMSKKLAAGTETIVLDVKYGSGAFMKTPEDAQRLALTMVNIGRLMNKKIGALVTSMEYPLGHMIGNTLEVIEAVKILRGELQGNAREVSVHLAANLLSLSKGYDFDSALSAVNNAIDSGASYAKFLEWIAAQGGDIDYITNDRLPVGKYSRVITAQRGGCIVSANGEKIGMTSCALGAGRTTKTDVPDLTAGLILHTGLGNRVEAGDPIATFYTSDERKLDDAEAVFDGSLIISEDKSQYKHPPLIYKTIR